MAVVSTAGRCINEIEYVEHSEIRLYCIAPRICVLCERNALGSGEASASEHCSSHTVGPGKASAARRRLIRLVYHAGPTSGRWAFCIFTPFNEKT